MDLVSSMFLSFHLASACSIPPRIGTWTRSDARYYQGSGRKMGIAILRDVGQEQLARHRCVPGFARPDATEISQRATAEAQVQEQAQTPYWPVSNYVNLFPLNLCPTFIYLVSRLFFCRYMKWKLIRGDRIYIAMLSRYSYIHSFIPYAHSFLGHRLYLS